MENYYDVVLSDNPVGLWKADDLSGSSVIADSVGNNSLSISGAAVFEDQLGTPSVPVGVRLSGGAYADTSAIDFGFFNTAGSFEFVFKINSWQSTWGRLVRIGHDSNRAQVSVVRNGSSNEIAATTYGATLYPVYAPIIGETHHCVVTCDETYTRFFIDGVNVSRGLLSFNISANNIRVANSSGGGDYSDITFGALSVYDKILSVTDIRRRFYAVNGINEYAIKLHHQKISSVSRTFGRGRISGVVKVSGAAAEKDVYVLNFMTREFVAKTRSNRDGAFIIENLDESAEYTVISVDDGRVYNDVVAARIKPVVV